MAGKIRWIILFLVCVQPMVLLARPAPVPINTEPVLTQTTGEVHENGNTHGITHEMMVLVLQLALLIFAARICGEFFQRALKQPAVLGELCSGMLIGPYALGAYLDFPGIGPLFPLLEGNGIPVSPALYGIATLASIILLFMVGLETDLEKFRRYAGPGFAVGAGGVVFSFLAGDLLYVWFTGKGFMSPAGIFMGAVSTATSVGITARVLSEKRKLASPEGTTILAGAVIDDVLGIMILAVATGIAAVAQSGDNNAIDWGSIGIIALKAFGFWLGATVLGIWLSPRIAAFIMRFQDQGSAVVLGLGLALLVAGIAEAFGLAMIIGAYIMGLSLSKEEISYRIQRQLMPLYFCLVPVFFGVMGMLVNFKAMTGAVVFGLAYTFVAVLTKVLGSGLPCYLVGFNTLGAARVGMGMLPRGEVALIIAGVGAGQGYIGNDLFGVVIMMTLVTTLLAPPCLVRLFDIPKSGLRHDPRESAKHQAGKRITIASLSWSNHELLINCIKEAFDEKGFSLHVIDAEEGSYEFTGTIDEDHVKVAVEDHHDRLEFLTGSHRHKEVKQIVNRAREAAHHRVSQLTIEEDTIT